MSRHLYILDFLGNPIQEPDVQKWGEWMETYDRQVKLETIGDCQISTVFLGIDHDFSGTGSPVLWETMIFSSNPELDGYQQRCSGSREQAEAMHREAVAVVDTHR